MLYEILLLLFVEIVYVFFYDYYFRQTNEDIMNTEFPLGYDLCPESNTLKNYTIKYLRQNNWNTRTKEYFFFINKRPFSNSQIFFTLTNILNTPLINEIIDSCLNEKNVKAIFCSLVFTTLDKNELEVQFTVNVTIQRYNKKEKISYLSEKVLFESQKYNSFCLKEFKMIIHNAA